MDWKQILSLSNEDLSDERKEEIYVELIKDQKFDGKIAKKLFPLCLTVLRFKGYQVEKQREEIEMLVSSDIDLKATLEQVEKQKKLIAKFETDRTQYKTRIKELTDEVVMMQGKEGHGSGDDSPDQLSEIDRQQELMSNISMKNKHIKRLLRDIEKLEDQSTAHLNIIKELKVNVEDASDKITLLSNQLAEATSSNVYLEEQLEKLNHQLQEQMSENQQLVQEKKDREKEMENFSAQLEERILTYKSILDEKQRELDIANGRFADLIDQLPGIDIDSEQSEIKRLMDSLKSRDELIKTFEEKMAQLSGELMESTSIITKITEERDEFMKKLSRDRSDKCCEELQAMLEASKKRCQELHEMVELAENDNLLKSKQAFEAVEALRAYENSEDGLADALKKIHKLQESLHQKENQIKELVVELNAQNEIVAENAILRRRCGIPEEDIIETKGFLAKQKRYAKINERLNLKLRASEEMRLQLKIDKNDLKRRIAELESGERVITTTESLSPLNEPRPAGKISSPVEIKQCANCHDTYNVFDSVKFCKNCIMKQNSNLCDSCVSKFKVSSDENIELIKKIAKLEIDHQSVTEENENLRRGLNEILEKLRDYEGSERAIINPATLEKLLYILNLRNIPTNSDVPDAHIHVQKFQEALKITQSDSDEEVLRLKELVKSLSDKNDEISVEMEKLKILEKCYEDLVRSSELCDDDKNQLLIKSLQRCHEFESNILTYERKIEFLKNENDHLYSELKSLKLSSLALVSDLRMEILEKSQEIDFPETSESSEISVISDLRGELQQIRSQLGGFCCDVFKNIKTVDPDNILNIKADEVANVTVVENNFSTSFITRQELDSLKSQLDEMRETIKVHENKEKHLEELTKITQSQLKSQQLMLSQFSDEEISARHLIVDLQSQSNENYLLTKTTRELKVAKDDGDRMRLEIDELKDEVELLKRRIFEKEKEVRSKYSEVKDREGNNLLKIKYLKKSLVDLCNHYSSMTPVYLIADFVKDYAALLEMKKQFAVESARLKSKSSPEISADFVIDQLKGTPIPKSEIEAKIEIVKHKSSSDYLKKQLEIQETTIRDLHHEIARAKMNEVKNNQHWNAIKVLFNGNGGGVEMKIPKEKSSDEKLMVDKEIQVEVAKKEIAVNTEEDVQVTINQRKKSSVVDQGTLAEKVQKTSAEKAPSESVPQTLTQSAPQTSTQNVPQTLQQNLPPPQKIPPPQPLPPQSPNLEQKSLDSQLKKALILASSRSALLIETENRLSEAQGRIKALEKTIENRDKQKEKETAERVEVEAPRKDDHILSITIATLQNLLIEKDTTLSRYQELLKSERQHQTKAYDELTDTVKQLKRKIDDHETAIDVRNKTIDKLNSEVAELERKLSKAQKASSPVLSSEAQNRHVTFSDDETDHRSSEMKLKETQNEVKKMEQQIKDLQNTEKLLQNLMKDKDFLIKDLNLKLKASNDNLDTLSENFASTAEIDQLRDMLEEKDKHIQDLTETLNQFHDDQQKYINDSAINSAEQVQLISTDLSRADATNRVLTTQLEALKRQIASIQQREKQAREMIKTLKNQLIRRPVISVKSDKRPASGSEEHYQKKIRDLENELLEIKDELRRQININDNKKAKNAAELGLWDKQKRFQELSEKLKVKLTEKEIDYERMKANFQIAKNTILRLEREKSGLENKMKSGRYLQNMNIAQKTNCLHCKAQKHHGMDTPTTATSDIDSEMNHELISALKSRIEAQQRRIIALEFDGKGSGSSVSEIERMHEQLSTVESQNIRLEAKNIQLQLEYDLVKQNGNTDRQDARIKHLENYILVLKDELAQAHAKAGIPPEKPSKAHHDTHNHAMEQTILTLKRVIEKLKSENKYLKDTRVATTSTASYMSQNDRKKEELFEKLKLENEKLQKYNNDVLDKISKLEIELQLSQAQSVINVSCPHCNRNFGEIAAQDADVLSQQLQQKSALLEKAKTLLTRAAAKEKHLREQIIYLKKRVSDLEGIPVISEENSESG